MLSVLGYLRVKRYNLGTNVMCFGGILRLDGTIKVQIICVLGNSC